MSEWDDYGMLEDLPEADWGATAGEAPTAVTSGTTGGGGRPVGIMQEEGVAAPTSSAAAAASSSSSNDDNDQMISSGVDGVGMWKSWTHNYEHPRFACLDLLDNCFDAALPSLKDGSKQQTSGSAFKGQVEMDYLEPRGISIINNSVKRIKPLKETMTAYRSAKNADNKHRKEEEEEEGADFVGGGTQYKKDAIGEYGVGLKQACATLSDTSFVLTKNISTTSTVVEFEFGVIAKGLQDHDTVSLPHYSFQINTMGCDLEDGDDPEGEGRLSIEDQISTELDGIFREYPTIKNLITNGMGSGDIKKGQQKLMEHFTNLLLQPRWKDQDHVFQLIITDFIHTGSSTTNPQRRGPNGIAKQPAVTFLEEIQQILPKYYINVPLKHFQFWIRGKPIQFCYWQHRLVEMTKFEVHIPKDKPVQTLSNSNWAQTGYPLSVYCGFDAIRLLDRDKNQAKTCQLCIYSRQSGRLIEVTHDARDMLGLGKSGVDYSQGLTVIIDDVTGELPLKPTKDGLTWTKDQQHGETHKSNLFAWTGAVASVYWTYHTNLFKERTTEFKSAIATSIMTFVDDIENRLKRYGITDDEEDGENTTAMPTVDFTNDPTLERVEDAKFCMFSDVKWKKKQNRNTMKVKITKVARCELDLWRENTPATVWKFTEQHYPPKPAEGELPITPTPTNTGKKRGRPSTTTTTTTGTTARKQRRTTSNTMDGYPGTNNHNVATPAAAAAAAVATAPWERYNTTPAAAGAARKDDDSSSGEEDNEVVIVESPSVPRQLAFASPQAVRRATATGGGARHRSNSSNRKQPRSAANKRSPSISQYQQQQQQQPNDPLNGNLLPPLPEMAAVGPDNSEKIQKLEYDLQEKTKEVQELQTNLEQARRQLMTISQQQSATEAKALQDLQQAQQEQVRLQQENQRLQQSIQGLQNVQENLNRTTQYNNMLQQWKEQLEAQISASSQTLQTALQENQQLQQQKVQMERNLQQWQEARAYELRKMQQQIQSLKDDICKRDKTIEQMSGGSNGFQWGQGTDEI